MFICCDKCKITDDPEEVIGTFLHPPCGGCPEASISAVSRSLDFAFCGYQGFEEQLAAGESPGGGSYNYYLNKNTSTTVTTPAHSGPGSVCTTSAFSGDYSSCIWSESCTVTMSASTLSTTEKIQTSGSNSVFTPTTVDGVTVCTEGPGTPNTSTTTGGEATGNAPCTGSTECSVGCSGGTLPDGSGGDTVEPNIPPDPPIDTTNTRSTLTSYTGVWGATESQVPYWSKETTNINDCDPENSTSTGGCESSTYTQAASGAYAVKSTTTITLSSPDTENAARARTDTTEDKAPFEPGTADASKPVVKTQSWSESEARYAIVLTKLVVGVKYKIIISVTTTDLEDDEADPVVTRQTQTETATEKFLILGGTLNSDILDSEFIENDFSLLPSTYSLAAEEYVIEGQTTALTASEGTSVSITDVCVERDV